MAGGHLRGWWGAVGIALGLLAGQGPLASEVALEVAAGGSDRIQTPVCVELAEARILAGMPMDKNLPLAVLVAHNEVAATVRGPGGAVPGQLEALGGGKARLWWIVAELKAGQKATFQATIERRKPAWERAFAFHDEPGKQLDLLFAGRKVTRFMYEFDPDPKKRFMTAKPFTHVFDAAGEQVITSPGGTPFPHHRGIFLGYKVRTPDGKRHDFWHARQAWQRLDKLVKQEAGPVLGRMTAHVLWQIPPQGETVVEEDRTITVYRQARPELLLDFVSVLRSAGGALDLGGDPEHAGCQFRAHYEVGQRYAEYKKKKLKPAEIKALGKDTRYVHPPGMKPGRNGTLDMPWSTISYALGDSRFNVAHLSHPDNPKGTLYSAYRPYGRFGAYPKAALKASESLTLRYRIYVREGEDAALRVEEAQRLHADFATPPQVTVR